MDIYMMEWRNATVLGVDWEERKLTVLFAGDIVNEVFDFTNIQYDATDDVQAIKMILDRLIAQRFYKAVADGLGPRPTDAAYVASILADPYEWCPALVPDSPKAEPSCEEVPLLIGYEENSRELAIENGPVDAMCYLPTPKAAVSYFKKRLEAAAASGYVFCDEDADWASHTDKEREAVIRAGIRNQELHVTVCNGTPNNYKESYTIVIEKLKIYKEN